jgi:hypothetical protein
MRALAKLPDARFASLQEAADALERAFAGAASNGASVDRLPSFDTAPTIVDRPPWKDPQPRTEARPSGARPQAAPTVDEVDPRATAVIAIPHARPSGDRGVGFRARGLRLPIAPRTRLPRRSHLRKLVLPALFFAMLFVLAAAGALVVARP